MTRKTVPEEITVTLPSSIRRLLAEKVIELKDIESYVGKYLGGDNILEQLRDGKQHKVARKIAAKENLEKQTEEMNQKLQRIREKINTLTEEISKV